MENPGAAQMAICKFFFRNVKIGAEVAVSLGLFFRSVRSERGMDYVLKAERDRDELLDCVIASDSQWKYVKEKVKIDLFHMPSVDLNDSKI